MSNLTDSLDSESEFAWYDRLCGQLLRVQGEFERFAIGETHLYHVLFEFEGPLDDLQWEAFVDANRGAVGGGKAEHWECLPDRSLGGCFYGDLSTLDVFRKIATSSYLILREMQFLVSRGQKLPENCVLSLPASVDDSAWLQLVHQTARLNTAILRHRAAIWKLPQGSLLDEVPEERRWDSGPNDIRFPSHPISLSLHFDVFSSSSEAINCWVYPEDVIPVGGLFDHSPIELPIVEVEGVAESGSQTAATPKMTGAVEISDTSADPLKPSWDGRCLFIGNELVKKYRNPAINQSKILWAFQNSNWTTEVKDPFGIGEIVAQEGANGIKRPVVQGWMQKRRDTVAELNGAQERISFESTGDGYGVTWKPRI